MPHILHIPQREEGFQSPDERLQDVHKLQEAMEFSQAKKPGSTAYGAPPPPPYHKGIVNQGYLRQSNEGYPQSKKISPQ
jgi:hypothetical protein